MWKWLILMCCARPKPDLNRLEFALWVMVGMGASAALGYLWRSEGGSGSCGPKAVDVWDVNTTLSRNLGSTWCHGLDRLPQL